MISLTQTRTLNIKHENENMVRILVKRIVTSLDYLTPIADLGLRLWVAYAFFISGLVKIQSWETTVLLFEQEYSVPLLSPETAAYLGAFTELFFPLMLCIGLGGRFAAAILFIFNIIAVISYPDLNTAGLEQHKAWGLMLLMIIAHGPGKLSLDYWIHKKFYIQSI